MSAAVALGSAPAPFLAVYSIIFIVHGGFHRVVPPDITGSAHGELIAGIVAFVLFVASVIILFWMLNGTRRWPFVLLQLAVLGTAIDFLIDTTKGGPIVSLFLAVTSGISLVVACLPACWEHVGRQRPRRPVRKRRAEPPGETALVRETAGA